MAYAGGLGSINAVAVQRVTLLAHGRERYEEQDIGAREGLDQRRGSVQVSLADLDTGAHDTGSHRIGVGGRDAELGDRH